MSANRPDGHPRHISDERGREEMAAALIEQASHLTSTQIEDLAAAWRAAQESAQRAALVAAWDTALDASRGSDLVAARDAVRNAARIDSWVAARDTALDAARFAAWNAVLGWLVKDLISVEDFRTLTGPWESVMGRSWEVTA